MNKPPLGLIPKAIFYELKGSEAVAERLELIIAAMNRYIEARKSIPKEWIEEYNQIIDSKEESQNG